MRDVFVNFVALLTRKAVAKHVWTRNDALSFLSLKAWAVRRVCVTVVLDICP